MLLQFSDEAAKFNQEFQQRVRRAPVHHHSIGHHPIRHSPYRHRRPEAIEYHQPTSSSRLYRNQRTTDHQQAVKSFSIIFCMLHLRQLLYIFSYQGVRSFCIGQLSETTEYFVTAMMVLYQRICLQTILNGIITFLFDYVVVVGFLCAVITEL